MNIQSALLATVLFTCLSLSARVVESLDADWRFYQGEIEGVEKSDFDDSSWRKLDVPHDWSIEGEFKKDAPTTGAGGWLPSGVAWYRKHITTQDLQDGERLRIEFDGVMQNSDVWLNGKHLGHRPNGYISFGYDVTPHWNHTGTNILVVRADTSAQPASRWYSGAGIYRHVRLVKTNAVHVEPWGIYLTTPTVEKEEALVKIQTKIRNEAEEDSKIRLLTTLISPDGKEIAKSESQATINKAESAEITQEIPVKNPILWNIDSPQMLSAVTRILTDDEIIDEVTTPFGIRRAEFRAETGFWLNDQNFKLKGVCLHHDGGAVGAAVPLSVWQRRLSLLRELGVNAIRTSHNPVAPEFLDLCDQMGFLVMDEFFDCWRRAKNKYDYHLYFDEWAHQDLRDGILRDRNHPSVIIYSVGNEIRDVQRPAEAFPILRDLVEICHEVDPSRPVTQGLFRPNSSGDYENGLADLLDVIGTNYRDQELLAAWKDKPTRKIIGTEHGHDRSTWLACRDNPQHSGQFLWVGIDYLGESHHWPLTVYNVGLLDRCGFLLARGAERQSWWSDKPMVRAYRRVAPTAKTPDDPGYGEEELAWDRQQVLFADWTPLKEGQHEEIVEVYSNAEEIELFLNDRSLGKKATSKDLRAPSWKVPFEPGTLKAVASNHGEPVATDVLRTAQKASSIRLSTDQKEIAVGFDHVAHIEVNLVDENGVIAPHASDQLTFELSGPGKIIGVDSGDVLSTERFQENKRRAYQGRAIALIRATAPGKIALTVKAPDLPSSTIEISTTVENQSK